MSENNPYAELLREVKDNHAIKSFDELKNHMSNELLSYYQFDLPKEFDLVDLTKIRYSFRYMRNFSKTLSYSKSLKYIQGELENYFKYQPQEKESIVKEKVFSTAKVTNFKQVFFDLKSELGQSMVLEDITDISLEKVPAESIKNVINDIKYPFTKTDPSENSSFDKEVVISSQKELSVEQQNQTTAPIDSSANLEIEKLMKDFNLEKFKPKSSEEKASYPESSDDKLDETFKILGIGSIKKNLEKTIISRKKSEGLFFDEWVQENLTWVQFLIKKILQIDYLSLKDESHYLGIVRKYQYSDSFEEELKSLYKKLEIEH